MSVTNKIKVQWEFDVATDERLQELLEISAVKVEEMLSDEDEAEKLHTLCCSATDIHATCWQQLLHHLLSHQY